MSMISSYDKKMKALTVADIDFSKIGDGIYNGSYETAVGSAEVSVTIADGILRDINIVSVEEGKEELSRTVANRVLKKQSLQVDAVSGASGSTKGLRKAIEEALQ